MSALEEARELIEFLPSETIDQLAWLETRARKVAAAYIKACEALEEMRTRDDRNGSLPSAYRAIVDAALSCSAPPEDKQGVGG